MEQDANDVRQSGTGIVVGEDLYGASLEDLKERIIALQSEIARTEVELSKKQKERNVADQLFGAVT